MFIIQCAEKLAKVLNINLKNNPISSQEPLYCWHANVFTINRRRCVILMNNKTRFCVILYGLLKKHFDDFANVVTDALAENLRHEGFSGETIEQYFKSAGSIAFAKTSDRGVLGQINDHIYICEYFIQKFLPSERINIIELNKEMNRSPMIKVKPAWGIDAMKEVLK